MDEKQKIDIIYFYNRFQYKVDAQEMELLNIGGFKQCEKCKELIEPQSEKIKLCIKCQKNNIHKNCCDAVEQLPFICSLCDQAANEFHTQQEKKKGSTLPKQILPQQEKKLTPNFSIKQSPSEREDQSSKKKKKKMIIDY